MFRTAEGLPNPSCRGLCLSLTHLAPTSKIAVDIAEVPNNLGQIRITAEGLCQILDRAQRLEAMAIGGLVNDYAAGELLVKYPDRPAPEEVSGDRLRKFEEAEERVALRCQKEDPDCLG